MTSEIFEKKTRMKFKVSKCKAVCMNKKRDVELILNGEVIEQVKEHIYLGSVVSKNGERVADMKSRISGSKSVANEIVQICKLPEMPCIRLHYMAMLMNSCLGQKVKYGSALWDVVKGVTVRDDLNKIKPNMVKRVLELPSSTPSIAIQYEFGINDLSLDVLMEKIILAVVTLNRNENRLSRKLLKSMLDMNVPGYCTELKDACTRLNIELDQILNVTNIREYMKKIVAKVQAQVLLKKMMLSSKTDKIILGGFSYDGSPKKYLSLLDFEDAKVIFMSRYRMWPTKSNFPGRWDGTNCNICGYEDSDQHIFKCPGYKDVIDKNLSYEMLWDEESFRNLALLKDLARMAKNIIYRIETVQKLV